jgi:cysteinyl-tRNA synthetase
MDTERNYGYEWSDASEESAPEDPIAALSEYVQGVTSLAESEKVELLARIQAARQEEEAKPSSHEDALIDLVLALREELRTAKRFEVADNARKALEDMGLEIGDSPQGAQWSRR